MISTVCQSELNSVYSIRWSELHIYFKFLINQFFYRYITYKGRDRNLYKGYAYVSFARFFFIKLQFIYIIIFLTIIKIVRIVTQFFYNKRNITFIVLIYFV